jgi:hypothetical protein
VATPFYYFGSLISGQDCGAKKWFALHWRDANEAVGVLYLSYRMTGVEGWRCVLG